MLVKFATSVLISSHMRGVLRVSVKPLGTNPASWIEPSFDGEPEALHPEVLPVAAGTRVVVLPQAPSPAALP